MTIGDRIAQIRKEHALSQEAFGERLGVTRQSISKWESNASIPEVDKLLTISRLYGVSVGWILGEDTEKNPTGEQELTEEQLRMVEKIAEKYIAAIPVQKEKWKTWQKVLLTGCVIGLCIWSMNLYSKVSALDNNYNNLSNNIYNLQSNLNSQMNSMTSRVEEILEKQNHLLADYGVEIGDVNAMEGTVTFIAYAVPKSYVEGMQVDFIFESNGQVYTVVAKEGEGNRFSAEHEFPYSNLINASVVLKDGQTEQTQFMDVFEGIEESTKVMFWNSDIFIWGSLSKSEESQVVTMELQNPEKGWVSGKVYAEKAVWRMFVNGEFIKEVPLTLSEPSKLKETNQMLATGELDTEMLYSLNVGDTFDLVTVVTDNCGRTYICDIESYVLEVLNNKKWLEYNYVGIDYSDSKWLE